MSDSSEVPWSDNPNAPQIPSWLHKSEKVYFVAFLLGAIVYGIVVALFFHCLLALLNPVDRMLRRGTKWWLVAHLVAMFSFLTIAIAIDLNNHSVSHVDNRQFSGDEEMRPGPLAYEFHIVPGEITIIYDIMFPLNQWLADGLLLHRCYLICGKSYWIMAFPCLIYIASIVVGITYTYLQTTPAVNDEILKHIATSYFSIALTLSVLLTLIIVLRLILHRRNIRKAIGASDSISGLYTAVVAMIVESYALYAITFLLYIVTDSVSDPSLFVFSRLLASVQVLVPYLVILRVARRRALTNHSITSGSSNPEMIRFKCQEVSEGEETRYRGTITDSIESPVQGSVGDRDTIEEIHCDRS